MPLMQRALALAVLGLALVAGPTTAQDAPGEAEAAAMATAKANQALVKVKPRWVSGGDPAYPDSEKALGHHGVVKLSGILGVDGRLSQTRVASSSGAPVLDDLALASVQGALFEPARDAAGAPLPLAITVPVEFYGYKSAGPGGGILRYSCGQFARDMDWWRATFPKAAPADHELYLMISGVGFLASMNSRPLDVATIKSSNADFARRWSEAVETCRAHPERRFTQVLQPEGRIAENLAKPK
jgi:TonB family protein